MLFFVATLLTGLPQANAQCVPAPIIMGQGYQGGNPCYGGPPVQTFSMPFNYGQNGNGFGNLLNGIPQGQPFMVNTANGGKARCTWKDAAASAAKDGLVGGLIGAGLGILQGKGHTSQYAKGGALIGAAVGATLDCDTDILGNGGVNQITSVSVIPQQQASQQGRCGEGKVFATLNWEGHPQNGRMVCMAKDDVHMLPIEQQPKVAKMVFRCKEGQIRAKLNWEGHPQHNKDVCMSPDDPHRGYEAAFVPPA